MNLSNLSQFPFDVAISFAGEDRSIATQLFDILKSRNIKVFYDYNEQANLWGKDLVEHLTDVYSNKARYCIILVSKYYLDKPWTRIERRGAQARAFRQPEEYILPIRLDDTELPGLPGTIGYLDLRRNSLEHIADQIEAKLGILSTQQDYQSTIPSKENISKYKIPIPQVKKKFTQLDKDRFLEESYELVKNYFRQALSQLKEYYGFRLETDLREITTNKFIARIYIDGNLYCMCKIWLGTTFGPQSILYAEGTRIDITNDNSMNDYLSVDQAGSELGLRISAFSMATGLKIPDKEVVAPEDAAEYLWKRFTLPLNSI